MRTPHPEVRRLKAVKVNDFDIHDALRIVDDSGVADLLQEEMPRKKKGRKHAHSWRSILAFCLLTAINQRTGMHLAYGQRVWTGLSTQERDLLGFTVDLRFPPERRGIHNEERDARVKEEVRPGVP